MVHNCIGELLKPVIVHEPSLEESVIDMYSNRLIFKSGSPGILNTDILTEILEDLIE